VEWSATCSDIIVVWSGIIYLYISVLECISKYDSQCSVLVQYRAVI